MLKGFDKIIVGNRDNNKIEFIDLTFPESYFAAKGFLRSEHDTCKHDSTSFSSSFVDIYIFPLETSLMHCLAYNNDYKCLQSYFDQYKGTFSLDYKG